MREFIPASICILGRQPALGVAELESLYGSAVTKRLDSSALLSIGADEIDYQRLGGSVKLGRVLTILPDTKWAAIHSYLAKTIPEHLVHAPPGKFTLGISVHELGVDLKTLQKSLLTFKKLIRGSGRPVRIVPNKELQLNSAQVLHNKLTRRGGWELLLVRYGKQTIIAQTLFVQDIDGYADRDQKRPMRDAAVGMLPPKLAQTIINLAVGSLAPPSVILDPFCGTGVILQEAVLMGYDAAGTDLMPRMAEYANANLKWLESDRTVTGSYRIDTADAQKHRWEAPINAVATEMYLGPPLSSVPSHARLQEIVDQVDSLLVNFLSNLAGQLKPGTRACIAVPAWRFGRTVQHLPVLDHLGELGYNRLSFVHVENDELLYSRPEQIVARELLVINRK